MLAGVKNIVFRIHNIKSLLIDITQASNFPHFLLRCFQHLGHQFSRNKHSSLMCIYTLGDDKSTVQLSTFLRHNQEFSHLKTYLSNYYKWKKSPSFLIINNLTRMVFCIYPVKMHSECKQNHKFCQTFYLLLLFENNCTNELIKRPFFLFRFQLNCQRFREFFKKLGKTSLSSPSPTKILFITLSPKSLKTLTTIPLSP